MLSRRVLLKLRSFTAEEKAELKLELGRLRRHLDIARQKIDEIGAKSYRSQEQLHARLDALESQLRDLRQEKSRRAKTAVKNGAEE